MDFTSMNFGDLLFALNCDPLKNEIRKIEQINKRIVQTKNGIYFNNIYIYIYIHTPLFYPYRVLMVDIFIIFRVHHFTFLGYKLRFRVNSDIFITFRVHHASPNQ